MLLEYSNKLHSKINGMQHHKKTVLNGKVTMHCLHSSPFKLQKTLSKNNGIVIILLIIVYIIIILLFNMKIQKYQSSSTSTSVIGHICIGHKKTAI